MLEAVFGSDGQIHDAETSAIARLRAFEDAKLGPDVHRINGQIERGHGSFFKTKLTDEDRAHHAALEKLVGTEQKVADASAALSQAQAEHEAARDNVPDNARIG